MFYVMIVSLFQMMCTGLHNTGKVKAFKIILQKENLQMLNLIVMW